MYHRSWNGVQYQLNRGTIVAENKGVESWGGVSFGTSSRLQRSTRAFNWIRDGVILLYLDPGANPQSARVIQRSVETPSNY